MLLACIPPGLAQPTSPVTNDLKAAKAAYATKPQDEEAAWKFGRACFEDSQTSSNKTQRAEAAEQGIETCRAALTRHPNSAPLHYYLALNIGSLAQTRGLSALKLVGQMEKELLRTIELDAGFDYAGAERALGMVYRDAPSIGSVGNRHKAKEHLSRAVELAPLFPDNRLELIQGYLKWKDRTAARRELSLLEESLPKARSQLSGSKWAEAWRVWEAQLAQVSKELGEPVKLETPRH